MTAVEDADVEAIYELAPLQEGMLVDSLIARGADLYIEQIVVALNGPVSMPAMATAWRRTVERHAVLRTSLHWRDLERPLQVVHRRVDVPVALVDLTRVAPERRATAVGRFLGRDRERGLDLETAPLLRVAVLREGPTRHDLVATLHHAVLDGWSTTIVMEEIGRLYQSIRSGTPCALETPVPYRDYIDWIASQEPSASERYWRELLGDYSGATPVGRLGAKAGVRVAATPDGEMVRTLPRELAARLQRVARSARITLNTVVLGAWAIVLARHLGTDDLVVGAVVSGRDTPVPGVESIVGLLINTVPVRARLDACASVASWLGDLQAQQLRTRDHQHCSLTTVQGWSGVRRGDTLFESLFVFENHVSPSGSSVTAQAFERTGYPFTVLVGIAPDVTIKLLPDAAVVTPDVAARVLDHLVHVLGRIADDPCQPIGGLELMSAAERDTVVGLGRGDVAPVPEGVVHEWLGLRAASAPGAVALVVGNERVSYGDLVERADAVARWLVARGVGRGAVVGLCLPRGTWWVAAMVGVWKAGAAWVMLEPDMPGERLGWMAADAGVQVVVTTQACRGAVPGGRESVVVDGDWPGGLGSDPPAVAVGPGDAAWVLYTSGSSGRPKGVVGSHGGLMNRLWWGWRAAPYGPGEVACAKTRAGFVDAVAEVFGPLVAGVAVVVVDEATAADPARLAEVVVGEGVTRLVGVPSLLSVLFEVAAEELRASRLVEVTASGEPLSGALVRRLRAVLAGCRVVNLYGSTEVAGDATAYVVPPGWEGERVPIGRPLDNLWVQVVGPAGEVVPVGVVGELVVGGPQVALGYVGEVEGDRFVADRWSGTTAPVYRTGDVGRWRADGVLEYVGRADRQVKVRGVRVEPGEVEAVLVAHPAVVEAAVVARPGVDGGVELVGFVVVAGAAEVGADGVRGWLRARLVEQMVPAHLVVVAALPKLANGKVDRDALGSGAAGGDRRRPYEAPQGPDEQAVAAVFAELTGATRVGRHDDFFADLGGHSLLATRAVSRLRRPFGRDIPLRLLFEHPTVADLAPALAALAPTLDTAPAITAQPRERYRTTEVRR